MIEFLNLQQLNRPYETEIKKAIERVISSGWYLLGEELVNFEQQFARYCGTKYAIGVSNGLDALTLTLTAWKELGHLNDGDEILVPANSYIASMLAVTSAGLTPKLVEPSNHSFNLETKNLAQHITSKTKAILPVHLYGRLCDMQSLKTLAAEHDLLVLEDSAQAHGAELNGVRAGHWGDAGAFSFYPGKNLGALGDAGAITTDNRDLYDCLCALRNYGSTEKYHHIYQGRNNRMDEIQAAILSTKLQHLDEQNSHRRVIADLYHQLISNAEIVLPELTTPLEAHVWHLFVVRCKNRNLLQEHLHTCGVQSAIHYPIAPHNQPAYSKELNGPLPITETLSNEVLSLPISPTLSKDDVKHIANACNSFCH